MCLTVAYYTKQSHHSELCIRKLLEIMTNVLLRSIGVWQVQVVLVQGDKAE